MGEMVSSRYKRALAIAGGMAAFCAVCLIAESPMKKKGDVMSVFGEPKQDASAAPLQSVPKLTDDEAKRRATAAMGRLGFDGASMVVLDVIKADISQQARHDIITEYAKKYRGQALQKFAEEAQAMGFMYVDHIKFPSENPQMYGYMKSMAYGIALFGEAGLSTAINLVLKGKEMRDPSKDGLPLIYRLASAAVEWIRKGKLVPEDKAQEMLSRAILDRNTELPEKDVLARWSFDIDPNSACKIRDASPAASDTRNLMNFHIQNTLKGKVGCS